MSGQSERSATAGPSGFAERLPGERRAGGPTSARQDATASGSPRRRAAHARIRFGAVPVTRLATTLVAMVSFLVIVWALLRFLPLP